MHILYMWLVCEKKLLSKIYYKKLIMSLLFCYLGNMYHGHTPMREGPEPTDWEKVLRTALKNQFICVKKKSLISSIDHFDVKKFIAVLDSSFAESEVNKLNAIEHLNKRKTEDEIAEIITNETENFEFPAKQYEKVVSFLIELVTA